MSDNTLDKVLDTIFDQAAVDANNYIGENMAEAEEVAFSNKHEEQMKAIFRKEKNKISRRKAGKNMLIAFAGILALAVAVCVTILSVEPWRIAVLNYLFEKDIPAAEILTADKGKGITNEDVLINYIPDGFVLTEDATTLNHICQVFVDSNNNLFLQIFVDPININFSVDTEGATIEEFKLKNIYDAICISNTDVNSLVWNDKEYVYTISANIPKEEIIKIAENIERLK